MKLTHVFAFVALVVATSPSARASLPASLSIRFSSGQRWNYYRNSSGVWVYEHASGHAAAKRLPLAKIDQGRIYEEIRRSVVKGDFEPLKKQSCPATSLKAEIEVAGQAQGIRRSLCLSQPSHRAFYGRLRAELERAQGHFERWPKP
jgi:hypothetical protein